MPGNVPVCSAPWCVSLLRYITDYAEACGGLTPSVNWTGLGASPFQSADGTNYSLGTPVTGTAGPYTVCWGADASYMNVTVPANNNETDAQRDPRSSSCSLGSPFNT